MQVDELLKPFPIKEFHPFPRGLLGPGSHELVGPEALKLGFNPVLYRGRRGAWAVATCRTTRSTAAGCGWCAT